MSALRPMKFLLKLFPLETILKAAGQLLLDNKPTLVNGTISLIRQAETTIEGGGAKFAWVKARVLPWVEGKAGWIVDTAIHVLVAWFKKQPPEA